MLFINKAANKKPFGYIYKVYPNGFKIGAGNVTRTHDLLITNQLLYQLSYTSIKAYLFYHI